MNLSADTGIGSGPQASHDHDGEFSHTCEECLNIFWEDVAFDRIKKGDRLDDAAAYADRELAEMLAEYQD